MKNSKKNFHQDTDLEIIMLDQLNNYIGYSSWLPECLYFLQHSHHMTFEQIT